MNMAGSAFAMMALCAAAASGSGVIFEDEFKGGLADGWAWIREDPNAWRLRDRGLEILVLPGNMWGRSNNATNVLLRSVPDPAIQPVEVRVTVSNKPSGQYEQADLVWFYDEANMVKIGQELVDGVLCLVMGREENDKAQTLAKIPIGALSLELRLLASGDNLKGQYRPTGETAWKDAAECALPKNGEPKISLQAYQGPKDAEHWARFSAFRIVRGR